MIARTLVGPLTVEAAAVAEAEPFLDLRAVLRRYLLLAVTDPGQDWDWIAEAVLRRIVAAR